MTRKSLILILVTLSFISLCKAQVAGRTTGEKRKLSKQELMFLSNKTDSIKRNLNRMILYEKKLMQRNYYLEEKTALVNELVATVEYLKNAVDIVSISSRDIKRIFGRSNSKRPGKIGYDIETYQSNCPFMEIVFYEKEQLITRVEYKITDCQKWK